MKRNIIEGVGKYAGDLLTIITEDAVYDFFLDSGKYVYLTLGDFCHFCGLVTFEKLRSECDVYYTFDLDSFEVVERRETK